MNGNDVSTEIQELAETLPARSRPAHLWKKGQSGNPSGMRKGTKHKITVLKQDLEAAVRENVKPKTVAKVLQKMVNMALAGHVGAGKVILDKFITNAVDADAEVASNGTFIFQVRNLTLKTDDNKHEIIDVTPIKEA